MSRIGIGYPVLHSGPGHERYMGRIGIGHLVYIIHAVSARELRNTITSPSVVYDPAPSNYEQCSCGLQRSLSH